MRAWVTEQSGRTRIPSAREEAKPRSPPCTTPRHLPGPQCQSPQLARGFILSPRAASSCPRLRDARPRPGPWSGPGARGRETGSYDAEGCGVSASSRRTAGASGGHRRRRHSGLAIRRGRSVRAKVPVQASEARAARSLRLSDLPQAVARWSQAAGRNTRLPAYSCGRGARGRWSQSEHGISRGRSRHCRPAPPCPRAELGAFAFCRYSALALWTSLMRSRFPANAVCVERLRSSV